MDEKLLHEIEDVLSNIVAETQKQDDVSRVQAKIENLSKRKPYSLNNNFVQIGLFFFLIFLVSITQSSVLFQSLSILSFIISCVALLKTVADIFYYKKSDIYFVFIGIGILLTVCFSYYALWLSVLVNHSLLLSILSAIVIVLSSGFYLLHAYMSYLKNTAKNESLITALIVGMAWLLLFVSFLYGNILSYLLLIIVSLVLVKAIYDFSQRFVQEEK